MSHGPRLPKSANQSKDQRRLPKHLVVLPSWDNTRLKKNCLLTVVVAKDNRVTANFALVQPGIADAPKVIDALAKVSGDQSPPTAEQLRARRQATPGNASGRPTARAGSEMMNAPASRSDLARFDLESEKGLREAVKALVGEVQALRKEVESLREASGGKPGEMQDVPGAPPKDEKLVGLLLSFMQKPNEDATVDTVLRQVEAYVKDNEQLTKQAIEGWTRVIYLKHGTEYARKAGQAMVDRLKK